MPAVKRRLANRLAAVSLVLALGFAALWIRSVWWDDYARYYTRSSDAYPEVESVRGQLTLCWWSAVSPSQPQWIVTGWSHGATELARYPNNGVRPFGRYLGVGTMQATRWINGPSGSRLASRGRAVYFPIAYPMILFGAIGGGMLLLGHRWRRQSGCCPVCGYDLRATPERCPECGPFIEQPTGSAKSTNPT
jgi:hypothetical protein